MLVINNESELKNINLRVEAHGDQTVRAMDLKFLAVDVDGERLDSLIAHYREWLYDGDEPILQEVYPLKVRHKVENVKATVSAPISKQSIEFNGCDVAKIELTPRSKGLCDVAFTLQVSEYPDGVLDTLSQWQGGSVKVELVERQLTIDEVNEA